MRRQELLSRACLFTGRARGTKGRGGSSPFLPSRVLEISSFALKKKPAPATQAWVTLSIKTTGDLITWLHEHSPNAKIFCNAGKKIITFQKTQQRHHVKSCPSILLPMTHSTNSHMVQRLGFLVFTQAARVQLPVCENVFFFNYFLHSYWKPNLSARSGLKRIAALKMWGECVNENKSSF